MILFLSLSVWFRGGMAFSPGRLSAKSRADKPLGGFNSHAEFEAQCYRCHKPTEVPQNFLCMDCHRAIAEELTGQSGVHGKILPATACAGCHPDHQGGDFDPAQAAFPFFDHTSTDFSLIHHQFNYDLTQMACSGCHTTESATLTLDVQRCNTCHTAQEVAFMIQHNQEFGSDCLACHNGEDGLAKFDHVATQFPLEGKHSTVKCTDCHTSASPDHGNGGGGPIRINLFSGVSAACAECHPKPSNHQDVFDANCEQCHDLAGWRPANLDGKKFDHDANTSFSLTHHRTDYQGQPIKCSVCHPSEFLSIDAGACIACHGVRDAGFMQEHTMQYGQTCLECHDGRDCMRTFDHQIVFPLEGPHAKFACLECHKDGLYQSVAPRCVQCHAEPAIHVGFFGLECQECHSNTVWSPAFLKVHSFPLDHGEGGQVACRTCHTASYVEYTCYGCHEHQPDQIAQQHAEHGVSTAELPNCTQCHATGQKEEGG